tara:strand:- start:3622 stop:4614 length:993 start_codon:yes stop_codon:yes gene_type:complete
MAHLLDFMQNGNAAMAYVGAVPWHGLGQQLTAGASIDEWRVQAGLDWEVHRSPVFYHQNADFDFGNRKYAKRHVLFRSDTHTELSVVSKDYKIHQPEEVLSFFDEISRIGGFELETAGVLKNGEKIWGLAKVDDGVEVVDGDRTRPYLLLATSYDGTLATTARFTSIRVVCNNTLQLASADSSSQGIVKVPHSRSFDSEKLRKDLGIFKDSWERFQTEMRVLSRKKMSLHEAEAFTALLIGKRQTANPITGKKSDIKDNRNFQKIMELFKGDALGYDMVGQTAYGMLNAVTEWTDHYKGRSVDTRLNAAWFGDGNALKQEAKEILYDFAS